MKYALVIAPLFFLFSCSSEPEKTTNLPKIKLNVVDTPTVYLEDIADDISTVNLGPAEDSTIVMPLKFEVTPDYIMVADRGQQAILKYDKKGKLLGRIGKKGILEGEYTGMTDAAYDVTTKQWTVYDMALQRMFTYDTDGKFLKTLRIANPQYVGIKFAKKGNMYVMPALAKKSNNELNRLYFHEQMGDVLGYHSAQIERPHFINNQFIAYPNIFDDYRDSLYYLPQLDDKIYRLGMDKSLPVYQIDLPQANQIPEELKTAGYAKDDIYYWDKMAASNTIYNLTSLFINDNWVSFSYDYKNMIRPRTAFYSKKTGRVVQLVAYKSKKDPAFTSRSKIVATDGDYFVIAAPIVKIREIASKNPTDKPKKDFHVAQHRLMFFKLKDV